MVQIHSWTLCLIYKRSSSKLFSCIKRIWFQPPVEIILIRMIQSASHLITSSTYSSGYWIVNGLPRNQAENETRPEKKGRTKSFIWTACIPQTQMTQKAPSWKGLQGSAIYVKTTLLGLVFWAKRSVPYQKCTITLSKSVLVLLLTLLNKDRYG